MGSSDSDGQAPSRKRPRTHASSEDAAAKKTRGRPRVHTQDDTAADRRRTQIRLAQRAYRQRKETTIASLKGQNDRLQTIIDQMNKSFLQFNEAALKSGLLQLNPALAQQLKNVTESFVSLAKSAAEGHGDEEEVVEPSEEEPAVPKQSDTLQPQHVDVGWGYMATIGEQSSRRSTQPPVQDPQSDGYRRPPPQSNLNSEQAKEGKVVQYRRPNFPELFSQGVSWVNSSLGEHSNDQPLPFGLVNMLGHQHSSSPSPPLQNTYPVRIPTPRITPPSKRIPTPPPYPSISTITPKPHWTYSHDETTFARRLMRATLEAGFHLLGSAHQRPAALEYVFRLSLPYSSLNRLREKFKMLLARGTDEELDFWETPFIHLGGAGTHYPRRDLNGNVIKKPNAWTIRRIGPVEKRFRAESCEDPSQGHDLNIDLTGFEGEWFDSDDVDGYLRYEKGVHIDPKCSFQDAWVDDYGQDDYYDLSAREDGLTRQPADSNTPSFSSTSSSSDVHSSGSTPSDVHGVTSGSVDHLFASSNIPFGLDMGMNTEYSKVPAIDSATFFEQQLGLDLAPGFGMGVNNTSLLPMNHPSESSRGSTLATDMHVPSLDRTTLVRPRKKKAVLIDVNKLIGELIRHAVCLGRAPGYRRADVERAFHASLTTL